MDKLKIAFDAIDRNHNGQISYNELTMFLSENRLDHQEDVIKMVEKRGKWQPIQFPDFVDILRCSKDPILSDRHGAMSPSLTTDLGDNRNVNNNNNNQ